MEDIEHSIPMDYRSQTRRGVENEEGRLGRSKRNTWNHELGDCYIGLSMARLPGPESSQQ